MSEVSKRSTNDLRTKAAVSADDQSPPVLLVACRLHLFHDPTTKTAFLKFRLSTGPSSDKSYIYFFVAPEHVTNLALVENDREDAQVAAICGTPSRSTICLHLSMSQPATMIVPSNCQSPTRDLAEKTVTEINFLVNQTSLFIYVPRHALTAFQLPPLCSALSVPGTLAANTDQGDLSRLFGGQGGKVGQLLSLAEPGDSSALGLPAYEDVAGTSVPAPDLGQVAATSARKRQRISPSPDGPSEKDTAASDEHASLAAKSGLMRDQLRAFVQSIFDESAARRHQEFEHQIAQLRADVLGEIAKSEAQINKNIEERLGEFKDEIMEQVDERLENFISRDDHEDLVEDRVDGIKLEMEEFVKDEMRNVEAAVIDNLEKVTWHGTLKRSEND